MSCVVVTKNEEVGPIYGTISIGGIHGMNIQH